MTAPEQPQAKWRCVGCGEEFAEWPVDVSYGDGHEVIVPDRRGEPEQALCGPVEPVEPEQPQAMTLKEALMFAADRKWNVTFYGYPYSVLIVDDFGDDIAHEGNWPEAFSEALGYPVVERDDTAELVEALEQSTEALYAAEMVARATGAPMAHIAACIEANRAALREAGIE